MILGETTLSYLGIGLRDPVVNWGVLLQQAQTVQTVAEDPWLLTPALFVIVVVLAFNFVGDALRDAADPCTASEGRGTQYAGQGRGRVYTRRTTSTRSQP